MKRWSSDHHDMYILPGRCTNLKSTGWVVEENPCSKVHCLRVYSSAAWSQNRFTLCTSLHVHIMQLCHLAPIPPAASRGHLVGVSGSPIRNGRRVGPAPHLEAHVQHAIGLIEHQAVHFLSPPVLWWNAGVPTGPTRAREARGAQWRVLRFSV